MPPTKSNHLYKRLMDWGNRETEMASGAELLKSSHVEKSPTSSQNSINLCFYFSPSIDFLHIFCMTFGYGHKCSSLFVLFVLLLSIVLQIDYFFLRCCLFVMDVFVHCVPYTRWRWMVFALFHQARNRTPS